ncbi:MAG: AAA family ATPase [Kiloniellaceae bacterium]
MKIANVKRFNGAIGRLNGRAVPEHALVGVTGEAGLGKSRTGMWWTVQNDAVMIRAHPNATPAWVLSDLVRELGLAPTRTTQALATQAIGALAADPRPVVIDEVEHALRSDALVLDTLRDVADLCEVPLVLIGREGTPEKLRRHRQIWRRIGAVAEFRPLDLEDAALLAAELVELDVPEAVLSEILRAAEGRVCGVLGGLAWAEARLKRHGSLTAADFNGLGHPWARKDARVVGLSARARAREAAADRTTNPQAVA